MKPSLIRRSTLNLHALLGLCALLNGACSHEQRPAQSAEAEVGAQRGTTASTAPRTTPSSQGTGAGSSAAPKAATSATRQANADMLKKLNFADRTGFELASRGLIAKPTETKIRNEKGDVVWDMAEYSFVKGDAPPTVNPSLWRQAQLNDNYGLFQVTEGIYQLRGFDLSNMTLVRGNTGWIVIDPLTSKETSAAAWAFAMTHLPKLPIKAVIYTHSHVDHFGGVKGVVDEADVKAGKIKIYAPEGFMEHAISENVDAGNAMSRRAVYMYGPLLPRGPQGHVDAGLGKSTPAGEVTLIPPTDIIKKTGEKRTIDGVALEFLMAPNSEAPSEMLFYFPKYKALCSAEDATNTLHNLYTLRGAQVRDAKLWASYLHEAIQKFGPQTDVVFASHHWPHWGNKEVVSFLEKQRDMFKYLHDQTLRLANQGYTMTEIGEQLDAPGAVPASIGNEFFNRGYYGSVNHDAKAVYQRYLGWFDANPANLHQLPPEEAAKKYVEAMGGEENVLRQAREAFDRGDYRWVAEMVNHVVFANPNNQAARFMQADALEQLGYQSENATWRAFYLTGAMELRKGIPKTKAITTLSPDIIRAMSVPMVLQYLATRVDGPKAAKKDLKMNFAFSDTGERYYVTLKDGVMNYTEKTQSDDADVTYTLTRKTFDQIQLGQIKFDDAMKQGDIKARGNERALDEMMSSMVTFDPMFPIVTP